MEAIVDHVNYDIFDIKAIVDHVNYDKFDIKAIGDNVNYDILKIRAVGYHDKNDKFEKYISKSLYFPVYLIHWNLSRFKYVVFYNVFDTRTDGTRHFRR